MNDIYSAHLHCVGCGCVMDRAIKLQMCKECKRKRGLAQCADYYKQNKAKVDENRRKRDAQRKQIAEGAALMARQLAAR